MKDLDIIDILHDAVDAYLPSISDDDRRQRALKFVRGCKAYLATRPPRQKSAKVISFDDHVIQARVQRAVRRTRRSALAAATSYLQHGINEFGDSVYDCYD
ncbi:hypothetical protein FOB41_15175 [Agrobacterium pusense]|uniref:Uncharacterized protein n=1 Tax=Agrobacterium pusense TaxID=648995 RepID=A0A6H0ZR94_9HYPH|nr:hypothetical protein [Agrobacterium pusense]MBM7324133.1 hypothetical protein [Agrobacterium sp. S2]QIX22391.1 hypothetical protein FOB41_15175 [Agrobacterium pusense]